MTQASIELKNVTKQFKRQTGEKVIGLNNINLVIQPGEVIGVIGTNGAGKSTLMNCLTGQLPIDSGEILLGGISIKKLKAKEIAKRIGRVFQDPRMGTAPRMTVFENLMLAQKRGESRGFNVSLNRENYQAMINQLAAFKLDLEKRLDVPMENLSGGQRQAVSLIMATLQQPQLLLLDEHTAALDPRTAKQVMAMTQYMIETYQLTTLMITHHLQDAITYCDRVIVMHRGTISRVYQQDELKQLTPGDLYQTLENLVIEEAAGVDES
ncbi:ATP-binding cassette domain-containing protein [Aerococcaceae bacterium zg-BR9]|uniref:ABC transporter ATP-binding protein n=1 Tax=Aerococcaceae bacterium zg-1292 TaxID=2774330 RepID=UPI00406465DB|nr:ATP-binding cassette domain-containing protein [Aerococcaceae bacterium zg-BR9]